MAVRGFSVDNITDVLSILEEKNQCATCKYRYYINEEYPCNECIQTENKKFNFTKWEVNRELLCKKRNV